LDLNTDVPEKTGTKINSLRVPWAKKKNLGEL